MNTLIFSYLVITTLISCMIFICSLQKLIPTSRLSRLTYGLCLSPFVLAAYPVLLAFIEPGISRRTLLVSSSIMSSVMMLMQIKSIRQFIKTLKIQCYNLCNITTLLLIIITIIAFYNAFQPIATHDTDIYFNQSLAFAKTLNLNSIPGYIVSPGQLYRQDTHTFFFESLLSLGLISSNSITLGYPHDVIARLLSQGCFVLLFVALINLAKQTNLKYVSAFTVILTLCVFRLPYLTVSTSRDSFFLLSVVLFITYVQIYFKNTNQIPPFLGGIIAGGLGSLTIFGHTLGLIVIFCSSILFYPVLIYQNRFKKSLLFGLGFFIAVIPGCLPYIYRLLQYGTIQYGLVSLSYMGTEIQPLIINAHAKFLHLGYFQSIYLFLKNNAKTIGIAAFFISIYNTIICYQGKKRFYQIVPSLFFLGTILIILSINFNQHGFTPRTIFLFNHRYGFIVLIFSGLIVAEPISRITSRFSIIHFHRVVLVLIVALVMLLQIKPYFIGVNRKTEFFSSQVKPLRDALKTIRPESNWMTNYSSASYYVNKTGIFLYSTLGKEFIHAKSLSDVTALIKKWNIELIVLNRSLYKGRLEKSNLPFANYLKENIKGGGSNSHFIFIHLT